MSIHARILAHLREKLAEDNSELAQHLTVADQQAYHKLFLNFRGAVDAPKGLRLTSLGHHMLSLYFRGYPLNIPEDYKIATRDLLYLDTRAKMPYYLGYGEAEDGSPVFVMYDTKLGIMLKLADCNISTLRDMEM